MRGFNERSWLYYTDWAWYVGWNDFRFDLIEQTYVLSDYGVAVAPAHNHDLVALARQPRAVDELQVKLRKRATTPEERQSYAQYRR